ncbi:MAG: hypothetical protein ACOH2J_02580 [Allorhizobium sp.]
MTFSVDELTENPDFVGALGFLARQLQGQFDGNQRLARFLASHQRWLLSQAGFALHLEYDPAEPASGLTTTRLKEMIITVNAASRNTVLNFLDQLLSYRFIRLAGDPLRRPRRFEATEISTRAMAGWLTANLAALDILDGGARATTFIEKPELLRVIQPRIARRCIESNDWREPPERVAMFLWTEAGGLVMDDLIGRIDPTDRAAPLIELGRVDARLMAAHFMMSRTHLQRLLRRAVDQNCLVWRDEKKTHMAMSAGYLAEYCRWQATKFEIIDEAFAFAHGGRAQTPTAGLQKFLQSA